VTWPRFFGRKYRGGISGLNRSVLVVASAIGPILFSGLRDLTGSFHAVIFLCWFFPVAVLVAALWADNPQDSWAGE